MKRRYTIYIYAMAALLTAACSGNGYPFSADETITPEPHMETLTVTPTEITFEAFRESKTLTITSNTSWYISNSNQWLACSNTNGSGDATITLTAADNTSDSERNGILTIEGGGKIITVKVKQKTAIVADFLRLAVDNTDIASTTSMTFKAESKDSKTTFDIASNTTWTIAKSGDTSWFMLSKEGQGSNNATVTITVTADNVTTSNKTATLTITGAQKTFTIYLTQRAAEEYLTVDKTAITIAVDGNAKSFNISSNTSWSITNTNTWLSCSKNDGTGDDTITLTATKNTGTAERKGTITIQGAGKTITINVTQSADTPIPGEGDNELPQTTRRQQ